MIGSMPFGSGAKYQLLVFSLTVFTPVCVNGQGLVTCYICDNKQDNAMCTNTDECNNMQICMNEIRDENSLHMISKCCKEPGPCNQHEMENQNKCHPEESPSKCVYCCDTDHCNEQENPSAVNDITATPVAVLMPTLAADTTGCREALGMESGNISNNQITASSSFGDYHEFKGRLKNNGCWIPFLEIPSTVAPVDSWIQVNLLKCYIVSGIITQGGGLGGINWVWISQLQIQYGSSNMSLVNILTENGQPKTFEANNGNDSPVLIKFPEPLKTQLLRIVPISCSTYLTADVCALRFEVIGCLKDEYSFNSDGCSSDKATCVNTEDSIKCTCIMGYEEGGQGCKDIDECAQSLHNCDSKRATCVNTDGSFNCTCNVGYKEEGGNCQDHIAGTSANGSDGVAPTIFPSTTTTSTSALTSASKDRVITTSPQTIKSTATFTTTDGILPTSSPRSTAVIFTAAPATTLTGSDTTSPSTAKISTAASTTSLKGDITTISSTGTPTTTLTDDVTSLILSTIKSSTAASTATLTDAIPTTSNTAAITMTVAAHSLSTAASMTTSTDDIPTSSTGEIITGSGRNTHMTTLTDGTTTSPSTSRDSPASTTTFADRKVTEAPLIDEFENIARCVRQNTTFDHANLVIKDLNISEMKDILLEQGGSTNIVRLQVTKPVRAIITQSENLHMQVSTKFEEKNKAESRIVSRVMSIDLFDQITGEEISILEQSLTIVFETIKPNIPSAEKWEITPRCSFWNKVDGFWSDGGCKMVDVNGSKMECECDHLTSFAVLMQFVSYPLSPTDAKVLDVLSTLGLSVSVVCTCLTLAIYAYCRLLAFPRFMIHTNLCVALLNSHLIFLAGFEVNKNHETACIAIAFLLHYFLMSTFFWMLVEAIYLLMKTKASLSRRKVPVLAWIAVGWGLPLIVVAISALSNLEGYGYPLYRFSGDNQIIKAFRCWLEIDNGMIWAFVGPACFIITVNLAILMMVLSTFRGLKVTKNQSQLRRIKSSIRVVVVLSATLGLPWIFSLLNFSQYTVIFNYLFVLTNAFQGLFFLIYQCLTADEVQTKLKPLIRVLQRKITRNHGNEARSNQLFMIVRPAHVQDDSSEIPNPTATTSDGDTAN